MFETLLQSSYFALFLIIALGFMLGRIQIKGLSLDVSAVIFIALLFGHFGVIIPKELGNFGLVLFIFTIGIQAGPGFFDSFRSKGKTLIILTLLIVGSASFTGLTLKYIAGIDTPSLVGLDRRSTDQHTRACRCDRQHAFLLRLHRLRDRLSVRSDRRDTLHKIVTEAVAQRPSCRSQSSRSTAKRKIPPITHSDFPHHPCQHIRENTGPITTPFHDRRRYFPCET